MQDMKDMQIEVLKAQLEAKNEIIKVLRELVLAKPQPQDIFPPLIGDHELNQPYYPHINGGVTANKLYKYKLVDTTIGDTFTTTWCSANSQWTSQDTL